MLFRFQNLLEGINATGSSLILSVRKNNTTQLKRICASFIAVFPKSKSKGIHNQIRAICSKVGSKPIIFIVKI